MAAVDALGRVLTIIPILAGSPRNRYMAAESGLEGAVAGLPLRSGMAGLGGCIVLQRLEKPLYIPPESRGSFGTGQGRPEGRRKAASQTAKSSTHTDGSPRGASMGRLRQGLAEIERNR
jgi:hypothetical protein